MTGNGTHGFTLHSVPRPLLVTCTEAREVALSFYGTSVFQLQDSKMRFNYEHDALYFPYPSRCLLSYQHSLVAFTKRLAETDPPIRHLALLDQGIPVSNGVNSIAVIRKLIAGHIQPALRLEKLTVVFDDPIQNPDDPARFLLGVASGFTEHEIETRNKLDWGGNVVPGIKENYKKQLFASHMDWDDAQALVQAAAQAEPEKYDVYDVHNKWGDKDKLEICLAKVERHGTWADSISGVPYAPCLVDGVTQTQGGMAKQELAI